MNTVSFMSANFIARQVAYYMPQGWGQGDKAANEWFSPIGTFGDRFDAMLGEIAQLGFEAIDLHTAHLNYLWTTPEHLEIARSLLVKHKLRVVSYAGWFGRSEVVFRAACRLASTLNIPVLGGGTPLLKDNRDALVSILREFGIIFGIENHSEKTPEELLGTLGNGDEDVIGVTVDTGWFGTQGYDAAEALRRLAPQLKHVHLKDVKPRRAEKTGFPLTDIGHETCRYGAGIVPISACLKVLGDIGYFGAISVEHEPEDFDPRADIEASKAFVERMLATACQASPAAKPLRYAVVGCGNISVAYGRNLVPYPELKIMGAYDLDASCSQEFTRQFGGKVYASLEEILLDPEVDCVVNLTIHHAHVEVITKCLQAGKHVHTEKPIAMRFGDAQALVELAKRQNRRLSCAPVTWLGEAQQTAWKFIRSGQIGTPRVAYAEVNWARMEVWHPKPQPFYEVGPVFDVAVYPLTLLTAWFGAVCCVMAGGKTVMPARTTKEGKPFTVTTPDWQAAVLEFESGLIARLTTSFYVGMPTRTREGIEIHGDTGSLILDQWTAFNSPVRFGKFGQEAHRLPLVREPFQGIEFGRGVVELAAALRENRPHRNGAEHAAHVVEVMEAILTSVNAGKAVKVKSSFPAPTPMPWAE